MNKAPSPFRIPQWAYLAFFGAYALGVYFLLYRHLGLQPFQVNRHFFVNSFGSFCKRLLADLLPLVVIFSILSRVKKGGFRFLLTLLFLAVFWTNAASIGYYINARTNFQVYALEAFSPELLLSLMTPSLWLGAFLVGTIGIGLAFALIKSSPEKKDYPKSKRVFLGAIFGLSFYFGYFPGLHDMSISLFLSDSLAKKNYQLFEMEYSGLQVLASELKSAWFPDKIEPVFFSEEELKAIEKNKLNSQESHFDGKSPKNIVLIVVESLNQDFLSRYNPQIPNNTPFLDELISNNPHLNEFYPSGPFTIHGLNALLCGHTNLDYGRNRLEHECAPKRLSEMGYKTQFLRGFSKYYIGENQSFLKFGFQEIFGREDFDQLYPNFPQERPDLYKTWGFSDNFIFDEALKRLEQGGVEEKQFLTLLTVDTHTQGGRCYDQPYSPTEGNRPLFSVHCLDRALKTFFDELEEKDLAKDTLVLVTADQLYPNVSGVPGDELQTSFALVPGRIPFVVISQPSISLKATQGSQVDVAATLLDLAHAPTPEYYLGKSLISSSQQTPLGQDRGQVFVIEGGQFHAFRLNEVTRQTPSPEKRGFSLTVKVPESNPEELMGQLKQAWAEKGVASSSDELLKKWYYSRFFFHDLKREGVEKKDGTSE